MASAALKDGIEAVSWVVDERGLAGMSDLRGLPWALRMDEFFEAWVECIGSYLAPLLGGVLRSGRKQSTLIPLRWEPPFIGSQRFLLPDVVIGYSDKTLVLDAKYKQHWDEVAHNPWRNVDAEVQEAHRSDLLQVLAYSTAFELGPITACLVYPCSPRTWQSLKERGFLFHRARVTAGHRSVNLVLTAVPFGVPAREVAAEVGNFVRALD
jgi:hypothetical protein